MGYSQDMENMTPERLGQLIEASGTNPTALAVRIGRDKDYIRDYINGRKKSLKADDLLRIVRELAVDGGTSVQPKPVNIEREVGGVQVMGIIQAGAWIETYVHQEDEARTIPIGVDPRFPHASQYALRVIGDSMDLEAPDGSYVLCVNYAESGIRFRPGMIVHVERIMNELSETTLKQIAEENGEMILVPRSSNPVHKPISSKGHDGIEVQIRGVVLSVYNPKML